MNTQLWNGTLTLEERAENSDEDFPPIQRSRKRKNLIIDKTDDDEISVEKKNVEKTVL